MAFVSLPVICTFVAFLFALAFSRDLSRLGPEMVYSVVDSRDPASSATTASSLQSSSLHPALGEAVSSSNSSEKHHADHSHLSGFGGGRDGLGTYTGSNETITMVGSSSSSTHSSNAQSVASSNSTASSSSSPPTYATPIVVQHYLRFTHADKYLREGPELLLYTGLQWLCVCILLVQWCLVGGRRRRTL